MPAATSKASKTGSRAALRSQTAGASVDYGSLPQHVGYLLRLAQLRVWEDFYSRLSPTGISPSLFSALILVERNPGLQQSRLGEALGVARSGAMTMVDRLEQLGLVERRADPHDRRAYGLFLTADGQRRMAEFIARVQEHDRHVTGVLSPDEHQTLMRLLQKFIGPARNGGAVHFAAADDPLASPHKRAGAAR